MRKLLIGSTALVVAGIGAAPVAFAGEAPKVSVSGVTRLAYVIRDEDGPAATDGQDGGNFQFANAGTEVRLDASGTADNGLTYGVNLDFRNAAGVTVDEHYIFLEGGWGTLHLGGDDGVLDNMAKGGESVQVGNWGFDVSQTILTSADVEADIGVFASWAGVTGDDAKIAYYTPSFSGFSVGLSVQPTRSTNTDPTGSGTASVVTAGGGYGDGAQYEGAINYDGSFGDVGIGLAVGGAYHDGSDSTLEDVEALHAGGTLSFGGFSVGAGIMDSGDTNVARGSGGDGQTFWSVGAAYSFGAGAVSTSYFNNEGDVEGDGIDSEVDIFTVDLQYTVAEGMTAFAQYYTADSTTGAGASVQSDVDAFVIGTIVTY